MQKTPVGELGIEGRESSPKGVLSSLCGQMELDFWENDLGAIVNHIIQGFGAGVCIYWLLFVIGWRLLAGGASSSALQVCKRWRQRGTWRPEEALRQRSASIGSWKSDWCILRQVVSTCYATALSLMTLSLLPPTQKLFSWSGETSTLSSLPLSRGFLRPHILQVILKA